VSCATGQITSGNHAWAFLEASFQAEAFRSWKQDEGTVRRKQAANSEQGPEAGGSRREEKAGQKAEHFPFVIGHFSFLSKPWTDETRAT
jgi:hypothetical protein